MPHPRPDVLRTNATLAARENFRWHYDQLETQRATLISRLLGSRPTAEFALNVGQRT